MIYRDRIQQHKLFKQFDKLAEFEGVSKAEVLKLKGLVLDVADKVEPFMDDISQTFRQYTKHDLTHLLNIANHVHDFLPRQKKSVIPLNAIELAYIWLAILLHDVGMNVSEKEEQSIRDSVAYKDHLRHNLERLRAADDAEKAGLEVKARAIRDAVFAEFIRQRHAERVHEFVDKELCDSTGDLEKNKLRFRGKDLSGEICNLCESHNWGVRQSLDFRLPKKCVKEMETKSLVGGTTVNLCFLACCLRLGDILDFDRTRSPLSVFHSIYFTESISVEEWNKHLSINGVSVTQDRISFDASCETPSDFVAVHRFLDWVDHELQETTQIVREFPNDLAGRYQLNVVPVVDRCQVAMSDPRYVAGGFRFQMEYEQIMKLLMDKSLYPDDMMFLRELLQNALDACRYQQARAEEKGISAYRPRIQIKDASSLPNNPKRPNDGPFVEFRDNGVGMSLDQIENFFMRVGKSFYRSAVFMAERERLKEKGIHLDACSRFGIGFLSCFLGGDRILVETFQYGSRPLRVTIEGALNYFLIEQLDWVELSDFPPYCSPKDPKDDTPPNYSGTKITVFFREDWQQRNLSGGEGQIAASLENYAANQDCDIVISSLSGEQVVIPKNRWSEMASCLVLTETHLGKRKNVTDHLKPIWESLITPVEFELSEFHEGLRGKGAIWFLTDPDGKPAEECGFLRTRDSKILCSPFVFAARKVIRHDEKKRVIAALERLKSFPNERRKIVDGIREFHQKSRISSLMLINEEDIDALTKGDLTWAINMAREALLLRHKYWHKNTDEIEILRSGSLEELGALWKSVGCGDENYSDLNIASNYKLSLYGIECPGGFQSWDPAEGSAERHNWLPPHRLSVSIDTYGELSPEPAASRLFVPDERGDSVRRAVSMAFLMFAIRFASENSSHSQWLDWLKTFVGCWDFSAAGILPVDVRTLIGEAEKNPNLPDVSNVLWARSAAAHSVFGNLLVRQVPYRTAKFLDLTKPIAQQHIDKVADAAGILPDEVDCNLKSLTEYLGWDLLKGLNA